MIIFGALIAMFSSFFVVAAGSELLMGKPSDPPRLWSVVIFFSITGLLGFYMIIANALRKRKKDRLRKEKAVLRIIASKGGRVMPVEVASETNLLLDEAQKVLNRLCAKGRGELKILKNGTAVYVFEEFIISDNSLFKED